MTRAALLLLLAGPALADPIELYPKSTIESVADAPVDKPAEIPIDSAWRAVERGTYSFFAPKLSIVTDETAPKLLARQMARHIEPAPAPPDTTHDDSRAVPNDPLSAAALRDERVAHLQEAYEEPAEWRGVTLEVTVPPDGHVGPIRVVHSSNNAAFDNAAVDALHRSLGAVTTIGGKHGMTARVLVEAGASVAVPGKALQYEVKPRPKGGVFTIARGRFGSGRKTEVSGPMQPRVRTRVTVQSLTPLP